MTESESESSGSSRIGPILDLITSAGYGDANRNDLSDFNKLFGGLAWCISAAHSTDRSLKTDTAVDIEDALKSMSCPHALQATQIEDLDHAGIYPAVQWIVSQVKTRAGYRDERKAAVLTEMQLLKEKINEADIDSAVHKLTSLLQILKAMERQGSLVQSEFKVEHFKLLSEITELEGKLLSDNDDKDQYDYFDHSICELSKKLKFAKKELASKLRESISLKRQLDELPIEAELVQYERRFSELNVHMQDRLRRTRKYYETYNALLEIKDLMLKETSLLNSVDSQFREAIGNPAGRMKLIDSLEAILKGTQQKLEKVHHGLQVEQKALDNLRDRYSAAIANQRYCSELLKHFQK